MQEKDQDTLLGLLTEGFESCNNVDMCDFVKEEIDGDIKIGLVHESNNYKDEKIVNLPMESLPQSNSPEEKVKEQNRIRQLAFKIRQKCQKIINPSVLWLHI